MKLRPTGALTNALCIGAPLTFVALFWGRPDLLVLVLPLVLYVAAALVFRPSVRRVWRTSPESVRLLEGGGARVVVEAETDGGSDGTFTVSWPQSAELDFKPRYNTVIAGLDQPAEVLIAPARWGRFLPDDATISVSDPLGAWRATGNKIAAPTITVVPTTLELLGPDGVAHPVGMTGAHRSADKGDGSELADLREFRPGDRVRRINWRVTARRGTPYVTTTYLDEDTDVLVAVDTTAEVPDLAPTGDNTSLDLTMRATAAIARYYCGIGDRVAVQDFGAVLGPIPPGTGNRQARIVVDAIARARAERWSAADGIRRIRAVRSGTLLFVISPLLSDEVLDEIARLRRLGADVVVVDTFPAAAGTAASLDEGYTDRLAEAVAIRRLQRTGITDALRRLGIPTAPWTGPASLGAILQAMQAARTAPRVRGAR